MDDKEYQYEIINNDKDARFCAELIAEAFCSQNHIAIYDKTSLKEFYEKVSLPTINDVFDERLSFLVRHRSSGRIVATVIANDLYTYHHRHPYNASDPPSFYPILDLLDEMDNIFVDKHFGPELKTNLVLQVQFAATNPQHSGSGLATELSKVVFNYAQKEKGFKYVFVQTTNSATRHIYVNKMGGKEMTIIDPTTWAWNKNSNTVLYPYKDYKHESVSNILIELKHESS